MNQPVTLAAVLLFVCLVAPTSARDSDIKIPFLFSEDEKLPQTDLREALPPSGALSTDRFLNSPLTRLEYMLMRLESKLNEEDQVAYLRSKLAAAFAPRMTPLGTRAKIVIDGYARYDAARGKVLIGYVVRDLGRPRRPMRGACDEILAELERIAPQEPIAFSYHNTVLGVLEQRQRSEYSPALETLARNVVHRASVESQDQRLVHSLACQRLDKGAPVSYQRYSFELR